MMFIKKMDLLTHNVNGIYSEKSRFLDIFYRLIKNCQNPLIITCECQKNKFTESMEKGM